MLTSSRRKLWALAATALLRGESRRNPHPSRQLLATSVPNLTSSVLTPIRAFSIEVYSLQEPRLPVSCCSYSSSSSSDDAAACRCWSCDQSAVTTSSPFLSCPSCHAVQPIDHSVDYFQIFGIEREYMIKDENLDGKYKDWQKKLHPDLVHTKSEREKCYAAEQSALVIEAYRTLAKPISRALYLLQLEGMHVDEEKTLSDPELLTEVMEVREAIEEAHEPKALEQIKSQIQGKLEKWSDSFADAFKNREFDEAVMSIQRMIYYEKAIQEIVKKL